MASFLSCDYILKSSGKSENMVEIDSLRKNQIIDDKNEHGCDLKAGYKWSNLDEKCIRVFEEGYRLSSIVKDSLGNSKNAYFFIADEMAIDDSLGLGEFRGNALYKSKDSLSFDLIANNIKTNRTKDILLATELPTLMIKQPKDTLYISADTLYSGRLTDRSQSEVTGTSIKRFKFKQIL